MNTREQSSILGAAFNAGYNVAEFTAAMNSLTRDLGTTREQVDRLEGAIAKAASEGTVYGIAAVPQLLRELGCALGRHRWSPRAHVCWTCGVGRHELEGGRGG